MAKGKVQINSNDTVAAPQPRTLRSRKRGCPREEVSDTDDVQDTEGSNEAVTATLPQEDMISAQQHLSKQDPIAEKKLTGEANMTVKGFEKLEQTTVTNPGDPQLEGLGVHTDDDANKSGKDRGVENEEKGSTSQLCTDQLQVLPPSSEECSGSSAAAVEEQPGVVESCPPNLERNQETSREESGCVHAVTVKEVTKDPATGLPAKKKRRMGMCGLTEKERSHFLQTQKREKSQTGPERDEKLICCTDTADLMAQEENMASAASQSSPSTPADSISEQNQTEMKPQASTCGGDDRAETGVPNQTNSNGNTTVCDPDCSKQMSCEAGEDTVPVVSRSDLCSVEQEGELLGNIEHQEVEEHEAEIQAEKELTGEVVAEVLDHDQAITLHPADKEEAGDGDALDAEPLQVNSVIGQTRDEMKEELTADDGDAPPASPALPLSGFNSGSVELCEAAATPSGSERKDTCDPDNATAPAAVDPDHPQITRDANEPFASECMDYVSDSQLNTIPLSEVLVMERAGSEVADCPEDATDLICGLIRELSSLNRKVMAAHRELDNLRRNSRKSSRSSTR